MTFHTFGLGTDSGETTADVLGGKGAGLAWMSAQGLPVPPGFVIPVPVWSEYSKAPKATMKAIARLLPAYLAQLDAHFGYRPLLSVRSGSRVSCPGMMDTILNVGIDDNTSEAWQERVGSKCFTDSQHRLVTMYGNVVRGISRARLESAGLSGALAEYESHTQESFPDATGQLLGAIEAVFKSWDNDRAVFYRKQNNIPREWGTAVTVQAMVFGNLNEQSGSGVLFTRNVNTGVQSVTGEFLINAQGEDVVAGIRTPLRLSEMKGWNLDAYSELIHKVLGLEALTTDVQDVEFTIQDGKLYLLQTRNAKRTATAAIRIALDMVSDGMITVETAITRVSAKQLDQALLTVVNPLFTKPGAYKGIAACSGVVSGKPVFSKEDALECSEPCILITQETTPEDVAGMAAAKGVITMVGGETSHAAVIARGMDKPCIVGVGVSLDAFSDASIISMDGHTGAIWLEAVPMLDGTANLELVATFHELLTAHAGVVPVIFSVPVKPMPEALLYLGDTILSTDKAVDTVKATAAKVGRLYLDLAPATGSEAEYMGLFESFNPVSRLLDALTAINAVTGGLSHLVVLGTTNPHGFQTVGSGADLRSLVLASKELLLDGMDLLDPAIQKVLEWKKADGLQFVSVGKLVAGMKSMVSAEVLFALQKGV